MKEGLEGVRGFEIANSQAPLRNPPIRNPRNPLLLNCESPASRFLKAASSTFLRLQAPYRPSSR
eukprot:364162-Alexandrium_andersonii.AAC.1